MNGSIFVVSFFSIVVIGVESLLLLLSYRKNKILITRLNNTQKSYENRTKHAMSKLENALQEREQNIEELEKKLEYLKDNEKKRVLKDPVVARLKHEVEMLKKRVQEESTTDTLLIKQTLRSGDRICAEEHLVVVGDVNPGAEIVAGGDVIVLGALRGSVHAGMPANNSAVVIALDIQPVQLRIAEYSSQTLTQQPKRNLFPKIAKVTGNQIMIEVLHNKQQRIETLIATEEL